LIGQPSAACIEERDHALVDDAGQRCSSDLAPARE
jgi:hypothetical protein